MAVFISSGKASLKKTPNRRTPTKPRAKPKRPAGRAENPSARPPGPTKEQLQLRKEFWARKHKNDRAIRKNKALGDITKPSGPRGTPTGPNYGPKKKTSKMPTKGFNKTWEKWT